VNAFIVLLIFTIPILLWLASLKLNPWRSCTRCKGQQRLKGWVLNKAYHACPKCRGSGRQLRFGRRRIFGEPVSPSIR
jgi:DnaJ-class molecular chaperone